MRIQSRANNNLIYLQWDLSMDIDPEIYLKNLLVNRNKNKV